MANYDASVKKALTSSQQDLIDHKEHCSADPVKLATVGRERGHQVRIKRNDTEYGLYTVSQVRQESPDNIIRMGMWTLMFGHHEDRNSSGLLTVMLDLMQPRLRRACRWPQQAETPSTSG